MSSPLRAARPSRTSRSRWDRSRQPRNDAAWAPARARTRRGRSRRRFAARRRAPPRARPAGIGGARSTPARAPPRPRWAPHDPDRRCGRELDRPLERSEVVAEWIRAALRIEPDRRRDPRSRWSPPISTPSRRKPDDRRRGREARAPASRRPRCLRRAVGVDRVADERRERVPLDDQVLGRHRRARRDARTTLPFARASRRFPRPVRTARSRDRPGRRAPPSHGRRLGSADVVGMEVGDAAMRSTRRISPGGLSEPEAGVEERAVGQSSNGRAWARSAAGA